MQIIRYFPARIQVQQRGISCYSYGMLKNVVTVVARHPVTYAFQPLDAVQKSNTVQTSLAFFTITQLHNIKWFIPSFLELQLLIQIA
jgi:hypothetical protein